MVEIIHINFNGERYNTYHQLYINIFIPGCYPPKEVSQDKAHMHIHCPQLVPRLPEKTSALAQNSGSGWSHK